MSEKEYFEKIFDTVLEDINKRHAIIQEPVQEPLQELVQEPVQEPTQEPVKEPEPVQEKEVSEKTNLLNTKEPDNLFHDTEEVILGIIKNIENIENIEGEFAPPEKKSLCTRIFDCLRIKI
jgi:hypothetical protein